MNGLDQFCKLCCHIPDCFFWQTAYFMCLFDFHLKMYPIYYESLFSCRTQLFICFPSEVKVLCLVFYCLLDADHVSFANSLSLSSSNTEYLICFLILAVTFVQWSYTYILSSLERLISTIHFYCKTSLFELINPYHLKSAEVYVLLFEFLTFSLRIIIGLQFLQIVQVVFW